MARTTKSTKVPAKTAASKAAAAKKPKASADAKAASTAKTGGAKKAAAKKREPQPAKSPAQARTGPPLDVELINFGASNSGLQPVGTVSTSGLPPSARPAGAIPVRFRPGVSSRWIGGSPSLVSVTLPDHRQDLPATDPLSLRYLDLPSIWMPISRDLSDIPEGQNLRIAGVVYVFGDSDAGKIEISEDLPGSYTVIVGLPFDRMRVMQAMLRGENRPSIGMFVHIDGDEIDVSRVQVNEGIFYS